jgi:hypothetical protein
VPVARQVLDSVSNAGFVDIRHTTVLQRIVVGVNINLHNIVLFAEKVDWGIPVVQLLHHTLDSLFRDTVYVPGDAGSDVYVAGNDNDLVAVGLGNLGVGVQFPQGSVGVVYDDGIVTYVRNPVDKLSKTLVVILRYLGSVKLVAAVVLNPKVIGAIDSWPTKRPTPRGVDWLYGASNFFCDS